MSRLTAHEYRLRYGATTGDRIRLGDTDLWIRVQDDWTARGDEPVWGYAKNLRSRMAQWDEAAGPSELDLVLAGALVVDPAIGVVKADIGIKDGRIAGIGRAGSPAISDGIDLVIGPHTKSYMAYGLIATPGGVDTHVHTITPELLAPALSGGVTTFISAGFEEPPFAMERVLAGMESWPINIGMQAGARATDEGHLDTLVEAGAVGFKIHEDNGAYPDLIDAVLGYADDRDVTVSLHTDGLHESAELEDTVAAIAGRTVHAYHVEGTGGGHVPDLLGLVREPSILCSSTTPTLPFGIHTAAEHVPMTVLNHGLSWAIADDVALVRERVLEGRMAAEGPLHELGAISIINSDSQGMGRIGETIRRTMQLAHVMKAWRRSEAAAGVPGLPADPGLEDPDDRDDTARVLRYLAKATIEPAITHGISDHVGSLRDGRLADVILWKPAFFGVKPEWVFKGGFPAWGPLGEGNATVERAEPTRYRADWAGVPTAAPKVSLTFVSAALSAEQIAALRMRLGTRRTLLPVGGVRGLTRASLLANRAVPPVEIDVRSGAVSLAGARLAVDPVAEVPLSRRYLLR
ncbi:MAG TPA: urease subunit alpha [Candidatus Limnocylindrales bacterium]|nr:urease subunit alpha [Candidatus Limnocylindrales bacterium]